MINQNSIKKGKVDLIDPDPISVFLAIIGTVGNIASIAAYMEYKRDQRKQHHESMRKKIDGKLVTYSWLLRLNISN